MLATLNDPTVVYSIFLNFDQDRTLFLASLECHTKKVVCSCNVRTFSALIKDLPNFLCLAKDISESVQVYLKVLIVCMQAF